MKEQMDAEFLGAFFGDEIFLVPDKNAPALPAAPAAGPKEQEVAVAEELAPAAPIPGVKSQPEPASTFITPLVIKGQPESDTLVILNVPDGGKLPAEERKFLTDILKAVQLDLKETGWMNTGENPEANWEQIRNEAPATRIIAFGADESLLPEGAPLHEILTEGNKTILRASLLSHYLPDNKVLKRDLWRALQQLFQNR